MKLGDRELRLLAMLQADCKQSLKDISKKLGMPMSTVHEKVRKLEAEGVVKGYHAEIDPEKVGLAVTAYILVNLDTHNMAGKHVSPAAVAAQIARLPLVQEIQIVTGQYDLIVKVRARNIHELGEYAIERVREVDGINRTMTLNAFNTPKESPLLPLKDWVLKE
ncbi:MAG: Lrp/AsnC family transcriptional regulator [Candidatus Micrarchaeota archaeon]